MLVQKLYRSQLYVCEYVDMPGEIIIIAVILVNMGKIDLRNFDDIMGQSDIINSCIPKRKSLL